MGAGGASPLFLTRSVYFLDLRRREGERERDVCFGGRQSASASGGSAGAAGARAACRQPSNSLSKAGTAKAACSPRKGQVSVLAVKLAPRERVKPHLQRGAAAARGGRKGGRWMRGGRCRLLRRGARLRRGPHPARGAARQPAFGQAGLADRPPNQPRQPPPGRTFCTGVAEEAMSCARRVSYHSCVTGGSPAILRFRLYLRGGGGGAAGGGG